MSDKLKDANQMREEQYKAMMEQYHKDQKVKGEVLLNEVAMHQVPLQKSINNK